MMVDQEREVRSSPIARGVIIYLLVPARAQHLVMKYHSPVVPSGGNTLPSNGE